MYFQRTEKRVRTEKIDLDDYVDDLDSWHDNRRIKLNWVDNDLNSNVACAGICVRIMLLIVYLSESFLV